MPLDLKAILAEVDAVLAEVNNLCRRSKFVDNSDLPANEISRAGTLTLACIERLAPPSSSYRQTAKDCIAKFGGSNGYALTVVKGALEALRADLAAGRMRSMEELIHGDLFADFLEASQHLLDEGYKDPAAVIAGSVLEEHLRKLCGKSGIPVELNGRPKKADTLNADLAGAAVYSKLDLKCVTAWLDLRNKAAHGKYNEYQKEQVALLIQSIRDFVARLPA